MPLILDPDAYPEEVLRELARSLRADLEETRKLLDPPPDRIRDLASLETARSLLEATITTLSGRGPLDRRGLAADVNLAYAAMLSVIDLVKSHTDVPKVPVQKR